MSFSYIRNGPIVVGGVGGSGTRVIADLLSIFGFDMGSDINSAYDNLWYTLLFKRPKWFYENRHNEEEIQSGLRLLSKLMIGGDKLSYAEYKFLSRAIFSMSFRGHNNHAGDGKGLWPLKRAFRMLTANKRSGASYLGWGWKEPNSHLLIDNMAEHFEDFKYIHTIRHGLDMAFSDNQQQLYNWGPLYGVELPKQHSEVPAASLKYWARANQRVVEIAERLGHGKCIAVNFDELCKQPETGLEGIVSFLTLDPDDDVRRVALDSIQQPSSVGRHRDRNLSQFDSEDLQTLEALGFRILDSMTKEASE